MNEIKGVKSKKEKNVLKIEKKIDPSAIIK